MTQQDLNQPTYVHCAACFDVTKVDPEKLVGSTFECEKCGTLLALVSENDFTTSLLQTAP